MIATKSPKWTTADHVVIAAVGYGLGMVAVYTEWMPAPLSTPYGLGCMALALWHIFGGLVRDVKRKQRERDRKWPPTTV